MYERFNKAKERNLKFNKFAPANNTYLLKNNVTCKIYYIQNYRELMSTLQYLLPHIDTTQVSYKVNTEIDKYEFVILNNEGFGNQFIGGVKPLTVRHPSAVLGL